MENGVVVDVHNEKLPCPLNDAQRLVYGKQLAAAHRELEAYADEKKSLVANIRAKEEATKARISELSTAIGLGFEHRDVEVFGSVDYDKAIVTYRRRDTLEELRARGLRPDERQAELPGATAPATEGKVIPLIGIDGGRAGEEEAGEAQAIRAEGCGHLTAMPQDGSIPKFCKTCLPDGDEVAPSDETAYRAPPATDVERTPVLPVDDEPRRELVIHDYADEQPEPAGEPDEDQVTGEEGGDEA